VSNILQAISRLVQQPAIQLKNYKIGHNRANSMGEALEEYVKDIFAETQDIEEAERNEKLSLCFSYLGNQNNPPDIMLRGGDAIEVKKIESAGSQLALNSSYPKMKLFYDNPMLTQTCRRCENWREKDIIYCVGVVRGAELSQLSFVYGTEYAASPHIYERIKNIIHEGVRGINDIEFAETKELARVNRVDPLGITSLRIRGMWQIKNPVEVFRYIYQPEDGAAFNFMALINGEKYASFPAADKAKLEELAKFTESFSIKNVRAKNPDSPAQLHEAKLIKFFC